MTKQEFAAYQRERYYWLKEHGICVECGQEPAYKGLTRCICCRANAIDAASDYKRRHPSTPEQLEAYRVSIKNLYHTRKEAGLCVKCGKPAQEGKTRCGRCLAKDRQRAAEKRLQQGKIPKDVAMGMGLCCYCLKHPVMPEKKVCEACYPRALQAAEKARAHIDYSDHIFRRMNGGVFMKAGGAGYDE